MDAAGARQGAAEVFTASLTGRPERVLDVKAEFHNVPIAHDVLATFRVPFGTYACPFWDVRLSLLGRTPVPSFSSSEK